MDCREAHLKVAASSVTRGGMAEGSDMSDTAQSGHSPRAADVSDGVLAPTAGAEKGRGCPQSQSQFWRERVADEARWSVGSASQGEHTLDTGSTICLACRTGNWGVQALHPGREKPTCSLVACRQHHPACGGLTTAILDLNGKCSLHTAPWLSSADGHGWWGTGLF